MSNFNRMVVVVWIPQLVVLGAALGIFFTGNHPLAALVGSAGSCLAILFSLLYVIFVDSRRRWPSDKAFTRCAKIVTFSRDWGS